MPNNKHLLSSFSAAMLFLTPALSHADQENTNDVSEASLVASHFDETPVSCGDEGVEQFGRYIGAWDIQDWNFSADSGEWTSGAGATWTFVCLANGVAIQDFWETEAGGFGTNIRTYNTDTEEWEIAWAANNQQGLMIIEAAQQENGNIIMDIVSPTPKQPTRIIFHSPDEEGWNWEMLIRPSGDQHWSAIYKIRATRKSK